MKPATPLPWSGIGPCISVDSGQRDRLQNRTFALHAVNAYPRLIEALQQYVGVVSSVNDPTSFSVKVKDEGHHARDLLKELGESQ